MRMRLLALSWPHKSLLTLKMLAARIPGSAETAGTRFVSDGSIWQHTTWGIFEDTQAWHAKYPPQSIAKVQRCSPCAKSTAGRDALPSSG